MADLQSKLAASGTVIVPARSGNACQTLPDELCLEVLRFSSAYDLGRLGRTGTAMRTLSLRALAQLPGDWQLRRMGAPDHRVYFRTAARHRAQWEKPTRAAERPLFDVVDHHPPAHAWPVRPVPPPRHVGGPPGDWKSSRVHGDEFWFSDNLNVSQWERPCYEDAPLFDGQIRRANSHYRTRARDARNYVDQSP